VAEGIAERLSQEQLAAFEGASRDAYGHIRLADIPIGAVLRDAVRRRLQEIGVDATVVNKDIGYELRCAKPVPFDVEYTRTLGYGAVRYLLEGGSGSLIALSGGRVVPVTLGELQDQQTKRVRVRMVDITTESYCVARNYMTRLERDDLREPYLSRLAAHTNLTAQEFKERFQSIVNGAVPA
jgi:6-phosphofructokinase 1